MGQVTIVLHDRSSAAQAALDNKLVVTEEEVPEDVRVVLSPINYVNQEGNAVELGTAGGAVINLEKTDLEDMSV